MGVATLPHFPNCGSFYRRTHLSTYSWYHNIPGICVSKSHSWLVVLGWFGTSLEMGRIHTNYSKQKYHTLVNFRIYLE